MCFVAFLTICLINFSHIVRFQRWTAYIHKYIHIWELKYTHTSKGIAAFRLVTASHEGKCATMWQTLNGQDFCCLLLIDHECLYVCTYSYIGSLVCMYVHKANQRQQVNNFRRVFAAIINFFAYSLGRFSFCDICQAVKGGRYHFTKNRSSLLTHRTGDCW